MFGCLAGITARSRPGWAQFDPAACHRIRWTVIQIRIKSRLFELSENAGCIFGKGDRLSERALQASGLASSSRGDLRGEDHALLAADGILDDGRSGAAAERRLAADVQDER